jgi:hypothetical protein
MNTPESPDPLSRALADWQVTLRRNPQFRSGVWARVEAEGGAPSWAAYARSRPALVTVALTLALAAGAMAGRERARARVEAESDRLATSYVQSLDARTMRMP